MSAKVWRSPLKVNENKDDLEQTGHFAAQPLHKTLLYKYLY